MGESTFCAEREQPREAPAEAHVASRVATGRWWFALMFCSANALNYGYAIAMSRLLAPGEFALFAALFGAVYLGAALSNALMTATAAAVARDKDSAAAIVAHSVRRLVLLGLPAALAAAIAARPAADLLRSDDFAALALASASLWLLLAAAVGYGGLQGGERFGLLGAALIVAAAGRGALGLAFVWLGMGVDGAMLGVAGGLAASAALALATSAKRGAARPEQTAPTPLMPMIAALVASIAIAIPTSADVVLVRHFFSAKDAGAYAAVAMLGRIVVFGPLAISLALFPSMVRDHADCRPTAETLRRIMTATAVVAAPSAAAILIAWRLAPGVIFARYDVGFSLIAMYLGAMLAFALVVPLVYVCLAQQRTTIIAAATVGLALELVVVAAWHPSMAAVASVLLAGNLALLAGVAWPCLAATADAPAESVRHAWWRSGAAPACEMKPADFMECAPEKDGDAAFRQGRAPVCCWSTRHGGTDAKRPDGDPRLSDV